MIKSLNLKNFRNHENLSLQFNKKFVYITGANGSGKTSILESIHYIATSKSHRTNNDLEAIKDNKDFLAIKLETESTSFSFVVSNKGKNATINNKEIRKLSDFIGNLKVVMFSPEDLNLIKGSPAIRRNFLDLELMKISKAYLLNLTKYKQILKQRNSLLKTINFNDDYTFLNILGIQLYESSLKLNKVRSEFIDDLNQILQDVYKKFSSHQIQIKYIPSNTNEQLLNHFNNNQKQDIIYKTTTVGPHRDEFIIYFNNQNAKLASQGEIRLMVISLKLSLLKLIQKETNSEVVLLLDDVLSELDLKIQNTFLNALPKNIQVIMNSAIDITSNDFQIIKLKEK